MKHLLKLQWIDLRANQISSVDDINEIKQVLLHNWLLTYNINFACVQSYQNFGAYLSKVLMEKIRIQS